jgi:hypothetical protein
MCGCACFEKSRRRTDSLVLDCFFLQFTDMGEFEFDVVRTFTGEMTMVGASAAVQGGIHSSDEILGDQEVGFFNMIDTTDARLEQES